MNNKKIVLAAAGFLVCLSAGYFLSKSGPQGSKLTFNSPVEEALHAITTNDHKTFEKFVKAGGDLQAPVALPDGKKMTVAEAVAHYDRVSFVKVMQEHKKPFLKQKAEGDMLTIAITKNNPEMVQAILQEKPDLAFQYGEKKKNVLHLTSEACAFKVTDVLHKTGKVSGDQRSSDGATAMTAAARAKCLPVVTYWKDQKVEKVNFNKLDGKGSSVLSLLKKENKDEEVKALVMAIEGSAVAARLPASVPEGDPNRFTFYRKRKIARDELAEHNTLVEPEIRPLDTDESAEHSEFAD